MSTVSRMEYSAGVHSVEILTWREFGRECVRTTGVAIADATERVIARLRNA